MLRLLLMLFPLLRLALWAADSGDPGAGEADDPPAGQAGDTDPPTGGGQPGDGPKFTQAQLDKYAADARKKALGHWARENGFKDAAEVEELVKAKKEADDQAKTDLTKANERAQRESERAEAAEKRLYDIVLKFGFQLAAVSQVEDVEVAFLTAQHLGLLNGEGPVEVDLDAVEVRGMDKVLEKLLKAKPLLKKQAALGQPAGTGGAAGGNGNPPGQLTPEQEADYERRFGVRRPR